MRKLIKKILKESDDLQWIRDVKTNDTIAKEIYDKLNWIKRPDVTTDYIEVPWIDIAFAVRKRTQSDSKLPIISPSSFHKGFKDYVRENYGIFDMSDIRKVFNKIKELMGDKIHRNINESDDLDWIKGNPISVGKCFTLYKSDGGIDAIVTIKEMEQREWKDNIYQKGGKFDPDNITIHLVGVNKNAKERVGSSFRISYNDLVESMNDGDLAPTDCGNNINESDDLDWVKDVKPRLPLRVGTCLTFKHSKEEEEWVEDEYGNMIDHGKMNWHITSKFIDVYNDDKPTFSMVATDRMGESRQIFMEVEKVKELYEEGVYEPCKKQPYLKRVMKEELRHIGNEDEWDFNRIKLNTRLILPHTGVILKIVGFNPKYDTLKICGDFGCSKISIQNLQALIKDGTYKILKESDDLDWIRDVEPRLTKGLILCPNHEKFRGGCKEVLKVDKVRDRYAPNKLVYLKDLETGNRYANTIKDMMQWLSDGEYTVNNG